MIELNLPGQHLPLMNEWQRWHWRKRGNFIRSLAWSLKIALQDEGVHLCDGRYPLKRCRIRVVRFKQFGPLPDRDAMITKPVLDVLQPVSKRHPYGLGVIADDSREVITDLVTDIARGAPRIVIQITEDEDWSRIQVAIDKQADDIKAVVDGDILDRLKKEL